MMPDVSKIVVAGDWHGNTRWAYHVIEEAAELLKDEEHKLILHAGDFGIWPGEAGRGYISALTAKLPAHNMNIWFVDGNHEDFTQIHQFHPFRGEHQRITHLPRGTRWTWHGRTWLALGGAVSPDRALRKEGRDWWPEEFITLDEAAQVLCDGPADVMLTHDAPRCAPVQLLEPPPRMWKREDLVKSELHRVILDTIAQAIEPRYWIFGHYHQAWQRLVRTGPSAETEFTALNMDGQYRNWGVLDVRTMEWEWPE